MLAGGPGLGQPGRQPDLRECRPGSRMPTAVSVLDATEVPQKTTEPVERVRLGTEQRTEERALTEEVRKEKIEADGDIDASSSR